MLIKRAVAGAILVPLAVGSVAMLAASNASASTLPTGKTPQTAPAAVIKGGAVPNAAVGKALAALAEAAAAEAAYQAAQAAYQAAVGFTANTPAHVADVQAAAQAVVDAAAAAVNTAALAAGDPASSSSSQNDASGSADAGCVYGPDSCGSSAPVPNSDAQFNAPS